MGSFSGLGIGLSFVFGCILMGLVAELYYVLWWKKKIAFHNSSNTEIDKFSYLFCWKRPNSINSSNQELTNSVRNNPQEQQQQHQDLEMGSNKDSELVQKGYGEEGIETELMRMHNLCGPPRFLFTIKEESKEDLESEDGNKSRSSRKGSRTNKSLGDLVLGVDLTPLSSPIAKASLDCYSNYGFNPLFESLSEAEVNRLRSSPPPKFKFMKDAEDKLIRRLLMEENERKRSKMENHEEKNASFVSLAHKNQPSQVLPLVD